MRPGRDFKIVSIGNNIFKEQDQIQEILTMVDYEDSLILTVQGDKAEMTVVAMDHNHKIRERGILRLF